MIIASDGFACTGKSTVADALAEKMCFLHVNSGILYRTITLYLCKNNITIENISSQNERIKLLLEQIGFEELTYSVEELKQQKIGDLGSLVAQIPFVREKVSIELHRIATNHNVIVDGRDIGTTEFPNADVKFFFIVDTEERAKRLIIERGLEFNEENLIKCKKEIEERDKKDISREISPLQKAPDAIEINRNSLSVEDTVSLLCNYIANAS